MSSTAKAAEAQSEAIAKAQSIEPTIKADVGKLDPTPFRGNPDLFGQLVEDHDRHRALISMIEQTSGDSPERRRLFEEAYREMRSHAAAEEQALWSAVLRNPETTDDGRHAVAEHYQIDKLLDELAEADMSSPGWLLRFATLKDKYLHHLEEEEQEQFIAAEKHLSKDDIARLHAIFDKRKAKEKASHDL